MKICVNCRVEMKCTRNGVGADFGCGHVYPSDEYGCPECGAMILIANNTPIYDPDHKHCKNFVVMK